MAYTTTIVPHNDYCFVSKTTTEDLDTKKKRKTKKRRTIVHVETEQRGTDFSIQIC